MNWLMVVQEPFKLELSDEVKKLAEQLISTEQNSYKIELTFASDHKLEIKNAAPSLVEYIQDNLGGLNDQNLITLVDNSSVLGYTVDDKVLAHLNTNKEFVPWLIKRQFKLSKKLDEEQALDKVIEYARLTNRLPVYLYQGQTLLSRDTNKNPDIVYLDRNSDPEIQPKLLVTTTTFMIGHKRARWLQTAEKIAIINNASDTPD